ncbi:MAG TPA: hypothetical protein VLA98_11450 [Solirubrobacteraceae bacterium]|nr:hypothetical protein [Solirubrobacteraceae bacterium]HSD79803.1 hypothetical protein [Solirubrobacteraceae bacterium]
MTDKARIRIAGIVTVLFLAGVSTAGLATHSRKAPRAVGSAPAAVVQPAVVPAAPTPGFEADRSQEDESDG